MRDHNIAIEVDKVAAKVSSVKEVSQVVVPLPLEVKRG
jgi:hypothetical protein